LNNVSSNIGRGRIIDLVEEAPFLARKRTNKSIIESIINKNLLLISYRKISTNRVITRIVEPYELQEDRLGRIILFAYDTTGRRKSIKSFTMDRVLSAIKQGREFTPRIF